MKLDFDTNHYVDKIRKDKENYFHTFLNHKNLAAGILVLKPGEEDTQAPHESDEMYYVIQGDGFLKINTKDYSVSKGKSFFVAKDVEHFFHGNKTELVVLYFFGGPDT